MRVDDHDHAHNRRNRNYRRHIRSRYYRKLRRVGAFNWALLGPKGKEIYSPNAALHMLRNGQVKLEKRRVFGPSHVNGSIRTIRRNDVVWTGEGWLGKAWALKSSGSVKILFTETHGLGNRYTDRTPGKLTVVSRKLCWLPIPVEN
jgi:hypothetical protein